ncbi:MAG: GumC family protein [Thermodesulfobacteriota bacterium]
MADLTSSSQLKPDHIIEIVLRYRWILLVFMALALSFGLVKALTSQRIYEANTLILVQPQKVPQKFVSSVVSTGIEARISTISQQIMSRSNLENIIDEFGLFVEKEDMYLEDKIKNLRQRIDVNITRARHGSEAFTVKYKGSDPERVMRITNTLAGFFMDENLKVREAQAVGTSEFLEVELEKTRKKLEHMEQRLSAFRTKHMGGLPDEIESNLRTLDRLQKQLESKQEALAESKKNLASLKSELSSQNENSFSTDDLFSFDEESSVMSEEEEKLNKLKELKENLLLKYTEKHPDVAKLTARIEKLENTIAEKTAETEKNKDENLEFETEENGDEKESEEMNFGLMGIETQVTEAELNIKSLEQDIQKIEQKMDIYQKRVENTPKIEQKMQALKRDYNNINAIYNSLLDRKLEAEISVNMEKKQKGEQFRILDHARKPQKPISPDIKKIFVLFFGAGAALAGGLSFILYVFDDSVRRKEEIEDLGLNVIAEVGELESSGAIIKKKLEILGLGFLSLYVLLIMGIFFGINSIGIDRAIDLVKSFV